jgi:5-methylcytosine-specific restriction endonuclease McrA
MRAMGRCRRLLSLHLPARDPMEAMLTIVMEDYLQRHDPRRRHARRAKRPEHTEQMNNTEGEQTVSPRGNASADTGKSEAGAEGKAENAKPSRAHPHDERGRNATRTNPRYVPAALRDRVLARDGYRCRFVGADGVRCTQTRALEIDHIVPVALGGCSEPDNLRVLCRPHNILEAERLLGRDVMARYTNQGP